MPDLRQAFTPLITYTLFLTGTPEERNRPLDDVRRDIEALLEAEQSMVKREDLPQEDYNNARFAVVAWVDEMLMQCPEFSGTWRGALLQAKLYNTTNAGEEFFERLAKLNTSQQHVIELYHLVLCLGFRGRYYDESQETQLLELRRQYGAYLPMPLVDPLDFERRQEHITPQPYTISPPTFEPARARLSPFWVALPSIALAALLLWYFLPRRPNVQCLENVVASFDCANISPTIESGTIMLHGHVSGDEERGEVVQKIRSECAVKGPVTDQLSVIPPPFCRVMQLLTPLQDEGAQQGFGLKINPSKGCNGTYFDGEHIEIEVSANKPLRYLYIDYYDAGREKVTHLLPNQYARDNSLNDRQTLSLPRATDRWQMTVQYPFGREMFTAVSSPNPLFPSPRPAGEPAGDYLASLKEAIKNNEANPGKVATYCFTTSSERPSGAP